MMFLIRDGDGEIRYICTSVRHKSVKSMNTKILYVSITTAEMYSAVCFSLLHNLYGEEESAEPTCLAVTVFSLTSEVFS